MSSKGSKRHLPKWPLSREASKDARKKSISRESSSTSSKRKVSKTLSRETSSNKMKDISSKLKGNLNKETVNETPYKEPKGITHPLKAEQTDNQVKSLSRKTTPKQTTIEIEKPPPNEQIITLKTEEELASTDSNKDEETSENKRHGIQKTKSAPNKSRLKLNNNSSPPPIQDEVKTHGRRRSFLVEEAIRRFTPPSSPVSQNQNNKSPELPELDPNKKKNLLKFWTSQLETKKND